MPLRTSQSPPASSRAARNSSNIDANFDIFIYDHSRFTDQQRPHLADATDVARTRRSEATTLFGGAEFRRVIYRSFSPAAVVSRAGLWHEVPSFFILFRGTCFIQLVQTRSGRRLPLLSVTGRSVQQPPVAELVCHPRFISSSSDLGDASAL